VTSEYPINIRQVIKILEKEIRRFKVPIVTEVSRTRDPFRVLISCLLSLRTKDETTREASRCLFALGVTPAELVKIKTRAIEQTIYPVGFYKTKAKTIHKISGTLIREYGGKVPDEIDELLKLKGVGRKTANLVVTLGFGKPGICVDTHVHRISNRLGYVRTRTPAETEQRLREKLPAEYWMTFNDLLVTFGQNICRPISPFCGQCPVFRHCRRIGVTKCR